MTRKRRRKKSRNTIVEKCFGKWRVETPESLREELERYYPPELFRRLEDRRATWERDLNSDRTAIYRILRETIVEETTRIRRTRIGDYRFLFEILADCRIRFLALDIDLKRGKIYDRLRKRKK